MSEIFLSVGWLVAVIVASHGLNWHAMEIFVPWQDHCAHKFF